MLEPRIETLKEKKLVGKRISKSFSDHKISDLWRNFMPKRKEIKNTVGSDLFSVEVYLEGFFDKLDSKAEFEKWAAIEVANFDSLPNEIDTLVLPGGLYAVYIKGLQVRV